jgi:hypothetical protein
MFLRANVRIGCRAPARARCATQRSLAASGLLIATKHVCAPLRRAPLLARPEPRPDALRARRTAAAGSAKPSEGFLRTKIAQQQFPQCEIWLIREIRRSPPGAAVGAASVDPRGR